MAVLKLNPAQYANWIDRMAADFPHVMSAAAVSGAMSCVPVMHKATDESPPPSGEGGNGAFFIGTYKRAWKAGHHPEGAWIYNGMPYAAVIEHGRRPGSRMPPWRALVAWCKRKAKSDNPEGMARALARAIGRRGIKGRKVMAGAVPKMLVAFEVECRRVLARRYGSQP